jgi:hypothetical protein
MSDFNFNLQDDITQHVGLLENWATGHGVKYTTIWASTTSFGPAVSALSEQATGRGR